MHILYFTHKLKFSTITLSLTKLNLRVCEVIIMVISGKQKINYDLLHSKK